VRFYGVETLRHSCARFFRDAPVAAVAWTVPAVEIEDMPRFSARAHIDVSRSFMPKEFVKKYIDLLALHKLNRFSTGTLPTIRAGGSEKIKRYPLLTSVGALAPQLTCRPYSKLCRFRPMVYDKVPHGGSTAGRRPKSRVRAGAASSPSSRKRDAGPRAGRHRRLSLARHTGQQLEVLAHWGSG